MRVLTICDGAGVSEFYRTLTPYRLLAEAGEIELEHDDGMNPAMNSYLDGFDVVVFSRSDTPHHTVLMLNALRLGKRVVFDIDDNLFLLPPSIGPYQFWHERGTGRVLPRFYYLKHNIKLADCLTVSTEALGRQLCDGEPHTLRNGPGDYLVLPNHILASDWQDVQPVEKPAGEVWVGWWGIYNHWDDWRDIAPYIEPVIVDHPEVKLIVIGMPEIAHLFPALRKTGQLVTYPFAPPAEIAEYRRLVKSFDVALAPTSPCEFNQAKSDLKMLQYGAAGVPVIASHTTYSEWLDYATVIGDKRHWGTALDYCLENQAEVEAQAKELQVKVLTERTYEGNYRAWLKALQPEAVCATSKILSSKPAKWPLPTRPASAGESGNRCRKRRRGGRPHTV